MPDFGSVCRLLEAIASAPYRAGTSAGRGEIRRHERVRDCSAHTFNRSIKVLFRLCPGALDQAFTGLGDPQQLTNALRRLSSASSCGRRSSTHSTVNEDQQQRCRPTLESSRVETFGLTMRRTIERISNASICPNARS